MPSDEYASVSGGALRLKGAKVEKHKKKHKKDRKEKKDRRDKDKDRLRAERAGELAEDEPKDKGKDKGKEHDTAEAASDNDDDPYARMTPAERRFAEAQDQKVWPLWRESVDEIILTHNRSAV